MDVDDVRMAQLACLADLLTQLRERRGLQPVLEDLDGEPVAAHLLVGGQIHDPHPALAELALDAVTAAQQPTRWQPHCGRPLRSSRYGATARQQFGELLRRWTVLCTRGELRVDRRPAR